MMASLAVLFTLVGLLLELGMLVASRAARQRRLQNPQESR